MNNEGLSLPPDPSEDIKRMLTAAEQSKTAEAATSSAPELPDKAFALSGEQLREYLNGLQGADVPVRREPRVGEPVVDTNGENLGIADSVEQPYSDQPNHYRVIIQGQRFHANTRS